MSDDTEWIVAYVRRNAALRWELARRLREREAGLTRKAAERSRAEAQDRREWINGIRRRLGLVTEVHEYRIWQVGERWWAWACLHPGCRDADWQHTSNSEPTRAAVIARASAHRRRFVPPAPEPAPGATLDLTGFGPACGR
jgi:hypothetical protein